MAGAATPGPRAPRVVVMLLLVLGRTLASSKAESSTSSAEPRRRLDEGGSCQDTNGGALDAYGDGCSWYCSVPSDCGGYDDTDFSSEMCCVCGGGDASGAGCTDSDNGAVDPYGDTCGAYAGMPSWCGQYDDSDFSSISMCCACGGACSSSSSGGGARVDF